MSAPRARILWLDLARTAALIGMIVFHFCYDLALFGLLSPAQVSGGFLRGLAVVVAASFVGLAGVSLQVAHGGGFRRNSFQKRLVLLVAAAAAISLLTFLTMPDTYIFFGILHSIALCSVLGLAFLRLPIWTTFIAAVTVLALPSIVSHPVFDAPLLLWTGLGTTLPVTLDYEPVFPWFAAFLVGMTLAKLGNGTPFMAPRVGTPIWRALGWPGRHSLWVYLAHQPILIALLWVVLRFL